MERAAAFTSFNCASVRLASAGLTSTAIRPALGNRSRSNSNRFDASSELKMLIPVKLPLDRERLVTKPSCTGSLPTRKTIGIVVVAAFAANDDGGPEVTIAATERRTRSTANDDNRSI